MNGKILVVGSLNMDLVISAPRLPQTGETVLGGDSPPSREARAPTRPLPLPAWVQS